MKEKYIPSSEEVEKAEEMMTEQQKKMSEEQERRKLGLHEKELIKSRGEKFGLSVIGTTEYSQGDLKRTGTGIRTSEDITFRLYVNGDRIFDRKMEANKHDSAGNYIGRKSDNDMVAGIMSEDSIFMMANSELVTIQILKDKMLKEKRDFISSEDWRTKYRDHLPAEFKNCESIEYQDGDFVISGKDYDNKPLTVKLPMKKMVKFDDRRDEK